MVTVCTPTYNRAHTLPKLYESLKKQTNNDFEWLIVDDGSIDETEKLVSSWINEETSIKIRYIRKSNGGKHTAVNCGVKNAAGNFFFIVDSDDYLKENAVEKIESDFEKLPNGKYAGLGYNKVFEDSKLVGKTFQGDFIDATSLQRPKFGIFGDKAEVFFTEVLRKYPFPVFEGEHFLTEAIVWNRIANDGYLIRWINQGIYVCEYRDDGLSMNASGLKNFKGYTQFIKELIHYNQIQIVEKIKWTGVYASVATDKGLGASETAYLINTNVFFVVLVKLLYKTKTRFVTTNRREKYKVRR